MFRKSAILAVLTAILTACNLHAAQINSTWIGGEYGLWEEPSNWNPPFVPENGTDTFAVTIDSATVEITSDHIIDSLDTYDTYSKINLKRWALNPVVLTVSNGFTNHGELDTPDTTRLHIFGTLINTTWAKIDIVSEELKVYGSAGIQNLGRVFIDSDAEFESADSDVNNSGTLVMWGGMAVAEVNFINSTTGIIEGHGALVGYQKIENNGLIESYGGTILIFGETISNTGTLKNSPGASIRTKTGPSNQSNEGLIEIYSDGAVAFDCNLVNEPNGIIKLLGGTFAATTITQSADAIFEGDGKISGNLVIEPNAVVGLTGPTEIYGDVQIDANAVLDVNDGMTLIKGHCTCNSGTIHLRGGRLIPQGGLTNNNCSIIWEPGLYNNVADFNLDGKVNLKDFAFFADTWLWQTQL